MGTALEEFARTRGVEVLGGQMLRRQWQSSLAIGGAFLAVGLVLLTCAAFGADPTSVSELRVFGLVMLLPAASFFGMGIWFRRQAIAYEIDPPFSREAMALLLSLVPRIGKELGKHGHVYRTARHISEFSSLFAAPSPPSSNAFEALERTAAAHNRILSFVGRGEDARAARLRNAADAGMGEALHLAATQLEASPAMAATIARMEELADLVGQTNDRYDPVSALRSNLESAIEELRAEAEAARELRN